MEVKLPFFAQKMCIVFNFPLVLSVASGTFLNREELISIRDSTRAIAVELHHVSGILDQVISRNGGPAPIRTNRRALEHIDHVSVEALLRQLRNGRSGHPVDSVFKLFDVAGEPSRSQARILFNLINIDIIFTAAYWTGLTLLIAVLFAFDALGALVVQGFLRLYALESTHPRVHPGRSRSPIREEPALRETTSLLNQIMVIIQNDKSMHSSSLLVSLSIQVILYVGNPYVSMIVYTMRMCEFLVICFLFWDNMNTMSDKIHQLSAAPRFGEQKHD